MSWKILRYKIVNLVYSILEWDKGKKGVFEDICYTIACTNWLCRASIICVVF